MSKHVTPKMAISDFRVNFILLTFYFYLCYILNNAKIIFAEGKLCGLYLNKLYHLHKTYCKHLFWLKIVETGPSTAPDF